MTGNLHLLIKCGNFVEELISLLNERTCAKFAYVTHIGCNNWHTENFMKMFPNLRCEYLSLSADERRAFYRPALLNGRNVVDVLGSVLPADVRKTICRPTNVTMVFYGASELTKEEWEVVRRQARGRGGAEGGLEATWRTAWRGLAGVNV